MGIVYVFDTSAFIDGKQYYPPEQFQSFWTYLIDMTFNDEIIVIDKVVNELRKGNDYLSEDFIKNIKVRKSEEGDILASLQIIMKDIDPSNMTGWKRWVKKADPWIIATALTIKNTTLDEPIIIHNEIERGKQLKIETESKRLGIRNNRIHRVIRDKKVMFNID